MEQIMIIKITPENTQDPEVVFTGDRDQTYKTMDSLKDSFEEEGIMCVSDEGWIQEYATVKDGYQFTLAVVSGIAKNIQLCSTE